MVTLCRNIVSLVVALVVTGSIAADVLFVDIDAAGADDGSSWSDAIVDLQDALGVAQSGDEIRVAEGTYKPTPVFDPAATFQLVDGVAIYGGFSGTESALEDRNWTTHETILSGEVGTDYMHNSFHVVTGSGVGPSALLDGFTVTGGGNLAEAIDPEDYSGAGMIIVNGTPTLRHLVFTRNRAWQDGGAIYNYGSSPTMESVVFEGNSTDWGSGRGGAVANRSGSDPLMRSVIFRGNYAWQGGAMHNSQSSPILVNALFVRNDADDAGGAMFNIEGSSPSIVSATIMGNTCGYVGGGLYNHNNCNPELTNVILWGNFSGLNVGFPRNNIFDEMANSADSAPGISYSIVRYSGGSGPLWDAEGSIDGGRNLDADPMFVLNEQPYGQQDPHITGLSPAIDTGDDSVLPTDLLLDVDRNPRVVGATVDMGAFEYQGIVPTQLKSLSELKALFESSEDP